ncbi:MAG: DUF2974 domain-containing protein, partial [Clostridia bacterium]|nr:DUF2974 domain-containing protein [Clostridia bacterium]
MFTILDYLENYKNVMVKDVHWNNIDNLLCAILVYIPLKTFTASKSLEDFYLSSQEVKPTEDKMGEMVKTAYASLEIIRNSERYKNLKVSNFINLTTDNTQFGACTFRISKKTIVSFKGTDSSIIGWIENFRGTYSYPTFTHNLAIEYLKTNTNKLTDTEVYVVGHSKGGNLAIVSAMEAPQNIFKKIKLIYNFDGPGLRKEQFESAAYKRVSEKLLNILPTGSVVGVLLYNDNYNIVETNALAFSQHYPVNWSIFGEFFEIGIISSVSAQLHENTTTGFENLDPQQVQDAFETVFSNLEKSFSSKFNFSFDDLLVIRKSSQKDIPLYSALLSFDGNDEISKK